MILIYKYTEHIVTWDTNRNNGTTVIHITIIK